MTTTYDPRHVDYLDEADVRGELARAFDVCRECRRCVDLCTAFPTLFDLLDRQRDPSAGYMTPAGQDAVVTACHQCKLCSVGCPYAPERHDAAVDMPRLMLRATAMRQANRLTPVRVRVADTVMGSVIGRTGAFGSAMAPVADRVAASPPRSALRKIAGAIAGLSTVRMLPPVARERFSTWFRRRPKVSFGRRQGNVTIFATCLVELREPGIGHDLVKVYERNGIECDVSSAGCCGAPALQSGDIAAFAKIAADNVAVLASEIRAGTDVVVPQPTCAYVLRHEMLDHLVDQDRRDDAALVAARTYDAAEYLMRVHRGDATRLDTDFDGDVADTVTYHAPCHTRAQQFGFPARDLIELTGAHVRVVQRCSGAAGIWGAKQENEAHSSALTEQLVADLTGVDGDELVGDCHLANTTIRDTTDRSVQHPLQMLARAYGITAE